MSDAVLLDTSAWLAWSQDEPGAGEIEAHFNAATAKRFDAVLVHKDPEFDALHGIVKMVMLPPKSVSL